MPQTLCSGVWRVWRVATRVLLANGGVQRLPRPLHHQAQILTTGCEPARRQERLLAAAAAEGPARQHAPASADFANSWAHRRLNRRRVTVPVHS